MNGYSQSPHPNPLPQGERGPASIRKFPLSSGGSRVCETPLSFAAKDQGEGAGGVHSA
jgi:hypothetical protein